MQLIAFIPIIVAIAGALLWVLASNPKLSEAGRIAFACGLLATCLAFSGEAIKVGSSSPPVERVR